MHTRKAFGALLRLAGPRSLGLTAAILLSAVAAAGEPDTPEQDAASTDCTSFLVEGRTLDIAPLPGFIDVCSRDLTLCDTLLAEFPASERTVGYFIPLDAWTRFEQEEVLQIETALIAQVAAPMDADEFAFFKRRMHAIASEAPDASALLALLEQGGSLDLGVVGDTANALTTGTAMSTPRPGLDVSDATIVVQTYVRLPRHTLSLYAYHPFEGLDDIPKAIAMSARWVECLRARNASLQAPPPSPFLPFESELEQSEFGHAVELGAALAKQLKADGTPFAEAVRPYGPLDLVVQGTLDATIAVRLRNMFLGVMGHASEIPLDVMKSLTNDFHCGPRCAQRRMQTLTEKLPQIRAVVARFNALERVWVLAAWPNGGFRFGNLIRREDSFFAVSPSPGLGLTPWDERRVGISPEVLAQAGISLEGLDELVEDMRAAGVTALVRSNSRAVRVVMDESIGDNEAGLLFASSEDGLPGPGITQRDGLTYVIMQPVAEGVYFYTTN